jgi:ATP-dependent RNA helicase RhlE
LAIQIEENIKDYGSNLNLRHAVIFGGVSQLNQINRLKNGIDILVATPGRLLDLQQQGYIDLRSLEVFVLDEADRMLDMGFIHDVKKVLKLIPAKRQTLFFSATMPKEIKSLASTMLTNPKQVVVTPVSSTAEKIEQELYHVVTAQKKDLLLHILTEKTVNFVLIFNLESKFKKTRIASFMPHKIPCSLDTMKAVAFSLLFTIRSVVVSPEGISSSNAYLIIFFNILILFGFKGD